MNIFKREWKSVQKQSIYWGIGIISLIIVAFYKVSGLNSAPGGVEALLSSLPAALRLFFGEGATDYSTVAGSYSMIHSYITIALSLHATMLGATIFAKEELDKTFEFLYIKGVKRKKIIFIKITTGITVLILMDIICLLAIYGASVFMNLTFISLDILPYLVSVFMSQLFFFSLALLFSLVLRNSRKAGMIGSCIVLTMFMVTMIVKVGGNIQFLDSLSIFHYADTAYITQYGNGGLSTWVIIILALVGFGISTYLHERRDLLA